MPPSRRPIRSGCPTHHHRKSLGVKRRMHWLRTGICCRDCRKPLMVDPIRFRARLRVPWWRLRGCWCRLNRQHRTMLVFTAAAAFFLGTVITAALSAPPSPPGRACGTTRVMCPSHR